MITFGFGNARHLFPLLVMLAVIVSPLRADTGGWTEYEDVQTVVQAPTAIPFEPGSALNDYDPALAIHRDTDHRLIVVTADTETHWLSLRRGSDSVIVLYLFRSSPAPKSAAVKPPPAAPAAAPAAGSPYPPPPAPGGPVPPSPAPETRATPPIRVPPPSLVLRTPPGSSAASVPTEEPPPAEAPVPSIYVPPEKVITPRPVDEPIVIDTSPLPTVPASQPRPPPPPPPLPADTELDELSAKPTELAIMRLADYLAGQGLHGEAHRQYQQLLTRFPGSKLRLRELENDARSCLWLAIEAEAEFNRFFELRRRDDADAAESAAMDFRRQAVLSLQELLVKTPEGPAAARFQLDLARCRHAVVRMAWRSGATTADSPAVVTEYLRAFVVHRDSSVELPARLDLARFYAERGEALLKARSEAGEVRAVFDAAIREYERVLVLSSSSPETEYALIELARLHDHNLEMRNFARAVFYYEELLRLFPGSPQAAEARERSRWIRDNYLDYHG